MKKRKGRKSFTKCLRLNKRFNKITDTLAVNSLTADILKSDIAGVLPKTAIYKIKNQMNFSDILHHNKRFLKSTNCEPTTRHDHGIVKKQVSAVRAL
jgi:hypothetical protein